MEKITTQHPLRSIELVYHRDRPQPEWEKETLSNYIHLHDEVWRLKTMCEEHRGRLDQLKKQIEDAHEAITPLVLQLQLLQAVAGTRAAVHVRNEENNRTFRIDMNDFLRRRDEIRNMMAGLHTVMTRCKQEYDRFVKATEAFETWFEVFDSESMLEIYRRYDEVSVDTVSLDHDHQNLLEAWQPIIFAEREYLEMAERVDISYEIITEHTDFFFEDVDMVEDALRELHYVGKSGIINIQFTDDGEYHAF